MKPLRSVVAPVISLCAATAILLFSVYAEAAPTSTGARAVDINAVKAAVTNAQGRGEITLSGVGDFTSDASRYLHASSIETVNIDSIVDTNVDVRLTFNPADVIGDFNAFASISSENAAAVATLFQESFGNDVVAVQCGQQGGYGFPVKMAVRMNREINTANLFFYTYDALQNQCQWLADQSYTVDANGYVYFSTTIGNYIVISDGNLEQSPLPSSERQERSSDAAASQASGEALDEMLGE